VDDEGSPSIKAAKAAKKTLQESSGDGGNTDMDKEGDASPYVRQTTQETRGDGDALRNFVMDEPDSKDDPLGDLEMFERRWDAGETFSSSEDEREEDTNSAAAGEGEVLGRQDPAPVKE
jgi:hypothetical protein